MPRTTSPRCSARRSVYLTRAAKIDGVPTVPSRWLLRLQALLSGLGFQKLLRRERPGLRGRGRATRPIRGITLRAPEPRPPSRCGRASSASRRSSAGSPTPTPSSPSASSSSRPLPAARPAARCGAARQIVHEALAGSRAHSPSGCRPTRADRTARVRQCVLEDYTGHPRVAAFWLPRFERFAALVRRHRAGAAGGVRRASSPRSTAAWCSPAPARCRSRSPRAPTASTSDRTRPVITDYKTGHAAAGQARDNGRIAAAAAGGGHRHGRVRFRRYLARAGDRAALHPRLRREPAGWSAMSNRRRRGAREGMRSRSLPSSSRSSATLPHLTRRCAAHASTTITTTTRISPASRSGRPRRSRRRRARGNDGSGDVFRHRRCSEAHDETQSDAADPQASAWVSANAGTGKTHVLTMRVLRLLLAGTKPERILCLTYTKAAAAEMADARFRQAGRSG